MADWTSSWKVERGSVNQRNVFIVSATNYAGEWRWSEQERLYVERAVNFHDELVAALRKCQIELHMVVNVADRKGGMYEAALNEARAVLAKLPPQGAAP